MGEPQVMETWYNKRLYRSRTEARWAVFLDTLQEPFVYEEECFLLPPVHTWDGEQSVLAKDCDVLYLPDFWLPRAQQYIEVKPLGKHGAPMVGALELEKAYRLMMQEAAPVVLLCGQPGLVVPGDTFRLYVAFTPCDDAHEYLWCVCPVCGTAGMAYEGRSDRLACKNGGCARTPHGDGGESFDAPRLVHAFDVARNARFDWHDRQTIIGQ